MLNSHAAKGGINLPCNSPVVTPSALCNTVQDSPETKSVSVSQFTAISYMYFHFQMKKARNITERCIV